MLDNLSGGGAEKVMLNLADGFAKLGYRVDILVCKMKGVLHNSIPAGVNLVPLKARKPIVGYLSAILADPGGFRELVSACACRLKTPKAFGYLPAIADHLRSNQVDVLVSALSIAGLASRFDEDRLPALINATRQAAEEISTQLLAWHVPLVTDAPQA